MEPRTRRNWTTGILRSRRLRKIHSDAMKSAGSVSACAAGADGVHGAVQLDVGHDLALSGGWRMMRRRESSTGVPSLE